MLKVGAVFAWDLIWPDDSNNKKKNHQTGSQQEFQKVWVLVYKESEAVAPPGCGNHKIPRQELGSSPRLPLGGENSPLESNNKSRIWKVLTCSQLAGWTICFLLFADGDDGALPVAKHSVLLPYCSQCSPLRIKWHCTPVTSIKAS